MSGLEAAYDDPEQFRDFCHRFRKEHPEAGDLSFVQWSLEPAPTRDFSQPWLHDEFVPPLSADWIWLDLFGDCCFRAEDGLEVHAANGRDLWRLNQSAPRLLRPAGTRAAGECDRPGDDWQATVARRPPPGRLPVRGGLAVQTVCLPVSRGRPAIGGLLLWKDRQNFLRLDRGTRGAGVDEISFSGCLLNQDVLIGRGNLASERVFLRMEWVGGRVNAFCGADGQEWFTVGAVAFPVEGPVEVGVHAIGAIDRTIYPGAYPEGTAIRFESFHVWR